MFKKCIVALFLILSSFYGFAQCGAETFTVVDWCENSYAEWTIKNPDPGAKYHWYEPVYATDGITVTDTIDRGYGANANGSHFVSPYRYTTPATPPALPTGWDVRKFWYVKEKPVNFSLAQPTTASHSVAPKTGYSMNFSSTLETNIDFITIPFFSYYVSPTYTWYIQIQIDGKFSNIYYFNSTDLIDVSPLHLLRVPVNIYLPIGSHTISIVTNPASPKTGTIPIGDEQVDLAMLTTATTYPINNAAGINITGSSNTNKSMIYKWETSTYCPYTFSTPAKKQTDITKCCTPVTKPLAVSSSNPIIISPTENSELEVTSYTSLGNFFQWYKNNSPIVGAGGIGKNTYTATSPGSYSVREVEKEIRLDNVSCYMETFTGVQERALFAKVNNPKASYCVGDKVNVEAYGASIGNISWEPATIVADPTSKKTDVTLSIPTTSFTFTVSADLFPDDLIVNGDFEDGKNGFESPMQYTLPPANPQTNGYTINDHVPEQPYWNTDAPFNAATQTKGDGFFFITDAPSPAGSLLWKQTVIVDPSKDYTFSMDHANISWNSTADNKSRVADKDLEFNVIINGIVCGSFITDGRGEYAGVGRWKTDTFIWNSNNATKAVIEIKVKNTALPGSGYDVAFDNIKFGGPQTQTATVSVGPIEDCYAVKASQGDCIGSQKTLTAKAINTVTGEEIGVIDRWEILPGNTVAGIGKTISVSPPSKTTYVAYGFFPGGNLIQNGDFELGVNGFKYGSANGLYDIGNTVGSISILKNAKIDRNNDAYVSMGDHTTGTGNMLLVDPKNTDGNVISYTFNAFANQNYLFSLWAANAVDPVRLDYAIAASLSFIINGPGVTNLEISSIDLPRTNDWIQLSNVWKPITDGAYTLTVRAKGDDNLGVLQTAIAGYSINGGNDFFLDDIILAEPTNKVYTDTLVVTPCVSCNLPLKLTAQSIGNKLAIDTICVGNPFTIQLNKIDTSMVASQFTKGGFYYYWAYSKTYNAAKVGTGYTALSAPLKIDDALVPYKDFTKNVSLGTDSGFYFLVIQDGPGLDATCKDSAVVRLRINKAPSKALIGKTQEICYNDSPADLVETKASATASYSEPVMYTWFSSSDSITKSKEVKLTPKKVGLVIAPTKLIANTYYVRQDSVSYCPMVRTNFVKIRVDNKPLKTNAKIVPAVRATLCEGEDFNLSAKLIDSSGTNASLNGGYYFTWKHYTTAGVLIPADTKGPLPYKDFLATTRKSVATDAGTYRLIFQDGLTVAGLPNCKDSIELKIVIQKPYTAAAIIKASDTICSGSKPAAFTEDKVPAGAVAPFKYQWYSSSDSFKLASNITKIASATSIGYTETNNLLADRYYVRIDSSGYCTDTTNILTIRVRDALTAGTIAIDTTICKSGKISLRALTVPTGGQKTYTYKWEYSKNAAPTVFIAAPGAVTDTFYVWDNSTVATQLGVGTYNFRRTVTDNGVCGSKSTATVSVQITDGLSQAQPAKDTLPECSGAMPLLSAAAADATNATLPANLNYKWQIRTGVVAGVDVFVDVPEAVGPTALTYQVPAALTSDTMYRRISAAGTSKCDSAIVKFYIKVGKELIPGKINKDTTICKGATLKITNKVSPSGGGSTNYTYVWKQSTVSAAGPYTPVPTSTSTIEFTTPAVNDTTWYVREVSEASCGTTGINSDTIKVSIYNLNPGKIGADTTICLAGTISLKELTAPRNGKGTYTYEWEIAKTTAVTFSKVTGADAFYTFNNSTATTKLTSGTYFFRRKVSDESGCAVKYTDTVKVRITEAVKPAATISTPYTKLCDNFLPITFKAVPTGELAPTYQWYILPKGSAVGTPVGTNSATFTTSLSENVADGDSVYVKVTSMLPCASPKDSISSKIGLTIKPAVAPEMISTDTSICESKTITFKAKGSVAADMQWFLNGDTIKGATGSEYSASKAGTYMVSENNGICEAPTSEVKLGIIPTPIANAGPDQTLLEGVISNLTGSGGETYVWSPATYLSSTTLSNPTFKATKTIPYTLVVKTGDCISDPKVVTIYVVRPITVPNVITVNGDGVNDTWEIENIEGFPNVVIEIYNRWGNLVWKTEGYPKNWDGTNFRNGEVLADGTYFYIINLKSEVFTEPYTGWVQIVK